MTRCFHNDILFIKTYISILMQARLMHLYQCYKWTLELNAQSIIFQHNAFSVLTQLAALNDFQTKLTFGLRIVLC